MIRNIDDLAQIRRMQNSPMSGAVQEFLKRQQGLIKPRASAAKPWTNAQSTMKQRSLDYRVNDDFMKLGEFYSDLLDLKSQHEFLRKKFEKKHSKLVKISSSQCFFESLLGRFELGVAEGELKIYKEYMDQVHPKQMINDYMGLKNRAEMYESELEEERRKWFKRSKLFHEAAGLNARPPDQILFQSMRVQALTQTIRPILMGVIFTDSHIWLADVAVMESTLELKKAEVNHQKRKFLMLNFCCLTILFLGLLAMFQVIEVQPYPCGIYFMMFILLIAVRVVFASQSSSKLRKLSIKGQEYYF